MYIKPNHGVLVFLSAKKVKLVQKQPAYKGVTADRMLRFANANGVQKTASIV